MIIIGDGKSETRVFVKISFNENGIQALQKTVYFRNEMRVDFFQRWKWYFEYRAALLRVKYPKSFVELRHGPYEYILPENEYREKVKNEYLSDKRQLTKFKNKLENLRNNWNELFPIEEHPDYVKVMKKLEKYQNDLECSKKLYESIFK